ESPPEHNGRSRSRRRGGSGRGKQGAKRGSSHRPLQLTSHPTGRVAYAETRRWLLEKHGPVCAYCGERFAPATMTLDHVAPRRGQTAYDRRDNLVLACKLCNAAKRDLAPIAFLLPRRSRAANLLRYGAHLSPMLIELASSLAPEESPYCDLRRKRRYAERTSPFTSRDSPLVLFLRVCRVVWLFLFVLFILA